MSNRPVNVALVGAAHIHTPNFIKRLNARSDVRVKSVWDHDADRARRRAADLGAEVVADVADVWSDPSIAGAIITSETIHHEALVLAGAAAGKHLFVEKPLGMGARDAYTMAHAIERAGVIFQTGYFQRGHPIHLFLRDQLRKGHFGQVTRYRQSNCHSAALGDWFGTEWRWMADPSQAGAGAFGDMGTHALDMMIWLLGDVESVTATVSRGIGRYDDCDENGEGLLRFANGAIGSVAASWDDIAHPVSLILSGTKAHAVVFSGQLHYTTQHVPGADGAQPWTDLPDGWPHAFELFLDAVVGKPDVPLVTPAEAAYRSAVMEAMYTAARESTWVTPTRG